MPVAPLSCIIDTNVVIDCHIGRVLTAVFSLPLLLTATEFLIEELQEPDGYELERCGLAVYYVSAADVEEIARLRNLYRALSVADLSTLVAAKALDAILLTGDGPLREAATKEGVPVRGTLWLLDELARLNVLAPLVMAQSLKRMLRAGCRLPIAECQTRLARWGYSGSDDLNSA